MREDDPYYFQLAEKWLNGTITEAEKEQLLRWYQQDLDDAELRIPEGFAASEQQLKDRIYAGIRQKKKARVISLSGFRKYVAAAAVLLLVSGSAFLLVNRRTVQPSGSLADNNTGLIKKAAPQNPNRATLTLSDGSTIVLDQLDKGVIATDHSSQVVKLDNGQLAYKAEGKVATDQAFGQLQTPVGGQYAIVLPDGTRVWLNASSSLRFPTAFVGKERVVELQGEAYFDVAKKADMPFAVKVGDMRVNVLGTEFNVMAYDDEDAVKTTLLNGSVRVREKSSQLLLKPGQQAVRNMTGRLRLNKDVNTDLEIAWRKGLFQFDQTDINAIMRQIARWYNVEVVFEQPVDGHFSGTIERHADLDKVLHMLELTGSVHFTQRGNKVLVHQ